MPRIGHIMPQMCKNEEGRDGYLFTCRFLAIGMDSQKEVTVFTCIKEELFNIYLESAISNF